MYSMINLTPRRTAILTFIRERIAEHGQSPSLAEISEAFGFASRSVARKHVLALTEAGFIEVNPHQAGAFACLGKRRARSCWIFRCSAGSLPAHRSVPMPTSITA